MSLIHYLASDVFEHSEWPCGLDISARPQDYYASSARWVTCPGCREIANAEYVIGCIKGTTPHKPLVMRGSK